jgi:HAD superfamily hydrolase (TIGR01662 family)
MTIRAVLFDVGGPLNTEIEHERRIDEDIRSLFAEARMPVSDARYAEAWRSAVGSFAPNAYEAVIWQLAEGDEEIAPSVYREVARRSHERGSFELREGIPELLAELSGRGLRLGLAANQPAEVIERLEKFGIARYFDSKAVSGTHGYRKPDVRLFLHACEALGVAPKECIMAGDRVDCDIVPAKLLGIRAVRLRSGRHAGQEPRTQQERPDAEATDVPGLRAAIFALLDDSPGSG